MMHELIGQQLIEEEIITHAQLNMALERQKHKGGRIGQNLVDLGFITEDDLVSFFEVIPPSPQTVEETGLSISHIADLIMKHVLFMGEFTLADIADRVKLPISVVGEAAEKLRRDQLLEIKGATQPRAPVYRYCLTEKGKRRSTELFEISRYMGPAPVTLRKYQEMVRAQTIKNVLMGERELTEAFSHLVVNEKLLKRLGPAVSSGKTIFLYGPPGNGKTAIAEAIGNVLPGTVYIPYAIQVESEIITVYDPVNHTAVEPEADAANVDPRWVLARRPVIMVGGELTLKALDLEFNAISKFYEAPLQMKANNGLFILDDFGRQQVDPQRILNRWIVPLERRTDFFNLHTGMKFEIPFDQLLVFATNIEPKNLVDEAFLRRIRYKIKIDHPRLQEYKQIFKNICQHYEIEFREDVFEYLIENFYRKSEIQLNACHPRDIIEHIVDYARYYRCAPSLTKETVSAAWESYFVNL